MKKEVVVTRFSPVSLKVNSMTLLLDPDDLAKWERDGGRIQDVLSYLTPAEREFLISGVLPEEGGQILPDEVDAVVDIIMSLTRDPASAQRQKLVDRVFCFTGALVGMTRKEAEEKVKQLGAKVVKSITKKVTDVVVGRGGGAKISDAGRFDVRILKQSDFEALLHGEKVKQAEDLSSGRGDGVHSELGSDGVASSIASDDKFWNAFDGIGEIEPVSGMPRRVVHRRTGAVLALILPGEFVMGSPASEAGRRDDESQHRRVIRKPFYIGVTAVTQAQWKKVMKANPSRFRGSRLPVETISWPDCQDFLRKAGDGLRLPSEAEWEYACRAGTTSPFAFGDAISPAIVNYNGDQPGDDQRNRARTVAVGSLPANAWGLHEMHGNVWEWCQDGYRPYPETGTEQPSAEYHTMICRGGSWNSWASECRAACRFHDDQSYMSDNIGFRLAASVPLHAPRARNKLR